MSRLTGRTLSHYAVLGELSRGGMGIVYRARDVKLEREVAFKVLPPALVSDPERRRRFELEARAAAALSHPNIGVIHEVDEVEGVSFIAMELIAGEPLSRLIAREPLPLLRALELAIQIAEGLSRAHEKGIVHRDLKPGNVMLSQDGHAKIIDFGLAKLVEPPGEAQSELATAAAGRTEVGAVMGTAAYMSPEQARGKRVDARSDVFAFGVVLHELVTGRRPFEGPSRLDVLQAIVGAEAPRLDSGEATAELQRIVDKCLAKDPGERYQGMRDVVVDLRAERRRLETGSVSALSSVRMARAPIGRRWLLALAAGLAVLVAAGVWLSVGLGPTPGGGAASIESIVALPATVHGSEDDAFLADAIPNALSTSLGRVPGLVTKLPPLSVDVDKLGGNLDTVAKAFAVQAFVVTAVTAQADGLILNVQLVNATSRSLLWSQQYGGSRDRFLELVGEAAGGLKAALRPAAPPAQPVATPGADSEVELNFQRGLYSFYRFVHVRNAAEFDRALGVFRGVLELDPQRAEAAAMIAQLYGAKAEAGDPQASNEAELWARRALDLDPRNSDAWGALAKIEESRSSGSYRRMLEYALRASIRGERNAVAHNRLGMVLLRQSGLLAQEAFREAVRLNPLHLFAQVNVGTSFWGLDPERGLRSIDEALEIEPEMPYGLLVKAEALSELGRVAEAAAIVKRLEPAVARRQLHRAWLAVARDSTIVSQPEGPDTAEAWSRLRAAAGGEPPFYQWALVTSPVARLLARQGRLDESLDLLERRQAAGAVEACDSLRLSPGYAALRGKVRFEAVAAHSCARFDETLAVLDAAQARGELPAYLATPVAELRAQLKRAVAVEVRP